MSLAMRTRAGAPQEVGAGLWDMRVTHRERETQSIAYKTSKTSSEREWTQVNIGLSTPLSPVCWMVQATH